MVRQVLRVKTRPCAPSRVRATGAWPAGMVARVAPLRASSTLTLWSPLLATTTRPPPAAIAAGAVPTRTVHIAAVVVLVCVTKMETRATQIRRAEHRRLRPDRACVTSVFTVLSLETDSGVYRFGLPSRERLVSGRHSITTT